MVNQDNFSESKIQQLAVKPCIYKITSPIGKIYIGQATNFKVRIYRYKRCLLDGQTLIKESIEKYGFKSHTVEVIHRCEASKLNDWERYYQDLYDVCGPNGLNCQLTRTSDKPFFCRPEKSARLSAALLGIPKSEAHKKAMVEGNANRTRSDQELQYLRDRWISINKSRAGRTLSDETKQKLREANLGTTCEKRQGFNHPNSKIVLDTVAGIFYGSVKHAAIAYNMNYATLKDRLSGRRGVNNNTNLIYV
jgi:group I intron endonuclease